MRLLVPLLFVGLSFAQTVTLELSAGTDRPETSVHFQNIQVEGARVGLGGSVGAASTLHFDLREALSFGPVGNLLLKGDFTLRTDARYLLDLTAQGVFGTVAARASLASGNASPFLFRAFDRYRAVIPSTPGTPGATWYRLAAGLSLRASRYLLFEVNPAIFLTDRRLGGTSSATLRRRRLRGDDDGELFATAAFDPAADNSYFALGATYVLNRRREPSWRFGLSVGTGSGGLGLGVQVEGSEPLPSGGLLSLGLAAEPYRSDVDPYRVLGEIRLPFQGGDLALQVGGSLSELSGTNVRLGLAWTGLFQP
ncbi:MAG: hypothetical protein OXC09_02475 [Truepera sp.]|nr:hypothetical protein [Truepera sp.]